VKLAVRVLERICAMKVTSITKIFSKSWQTPQRRCSTIMTTANLRAAVVSAPNAWNALRNASVMGHIMKNRVVFTYFMEQVVQLYLQTILFAMRRYFAKLGTPFDCEFMLVLTLILSEFMVVIRFVEIRSFFALVKELEAKLVDAKGPGGQWYGISDAESQTRERLYREFRRNYWCVILVSVLVTFVGFLSACKIIASYLCEKSIWNLWDMVLHLETGGCVDLNVRFNGHA